MYQMIHVILSSCGLLISASTMSTPPSSSYHSLSLSSLSSYLTTASPVPGTSATDTTASTTDVVATTTKLQSTATAETTSEAVITTHMSAAPTPTIIDTPSTISALSNTVSTTSVMLNATSTRALNYTETTTNALTNTVTTTIATPNTVTTTNVSPSTPTTIVMPTPTIINTPSTISALSNTVSTTSVTLNATSTRALNYTEKTTSALTNTVTTTIATPNTVTTTSVSPSTSTTIAMPSAGPTTGVMTTAEPTTSVLSSITTTSVPPGITTTSVMPSTAPNTTEPSSTTLTTTERSSTTPTTSAMPSATLTTTEPSSTRPTTSDPPSTTPTTSVIPSASWTTTDPSSAALSTTEPSSAALTTTEPSSAALTTTEPSSTAPTTTEPPSTTPTTLVMPSAALTTSLLPITASTATDASSKTTTTSVLPSAAPTTSLPPNTETTSSVSTSAEKETSVPSSTITAPVPKCSNLTEPVNGNVTVSGDGNTATYTCNIGYRLNGSSERTCVNATWSGNGPSCIRNCQKPSHPVDGNVSFSDLDTVATFTCKPGYLLNGSIHLTCGDGNWSDEVPSCYRKDCGPLTAPENGLLNSKNGTLFESVVYYTCNFGYNLTGTRTRKCVESGRWEGQTPSCSKVADSTCKCKGHNDIWGVEWYESLCDKIQWLQCPTGSTGNYTRQCDSKGAWINLNNTCVREAINNISNTLDKLNSTNVTADVINDVLNTMTAATTVKDSTNKEETLTGGEVAKLAESLTKVADILKSSNGTVNITTNITQNFLQSTSNLLDNKETWKTMKESGTSDGGKILRAVDTLTDVLRKSIETDSSKNKTFKTANIAIELVKITRDKEVKFPNGQFADELNWNGGTTKSGITFKPDSFNATFATGVLYRNMSDILPTQSSKHSVKPEIRGQVIAFSVSEKSVNLSKNITIQIEHYSPSLTDPQCSFWNVNSSGTGSWSTQGCFFVNSTENLTTCECNHLTNFAVLMSPFEEVDNTLPLRLVSIIGISVSMLGLLLTVLVHVCLWRNVKNDRSSLLMNLCVALLFAYIVFLSGVDRTESRGFCAAVAAILHYIYLVVFCLMLVEGIEIVITVVYVFATKSRTKPMVTLAWTIPAVIVGISIGVTKTKGYGNEKFCWLSLTDGVIWAFVGPALFIILLNIGSLVIVLRKLFTMKAMENKKFKDKIITSVRSLCVLVPLMGVSWVLGIFYVNEDLAFMQYVFAVCNGSQGFFIFLIHCVLNPKVRGAMSIRYRRLKSGIDTKDTRQKRSQNTYGSNSDGRNLILETSQYDAINPSTETSAGIGKIQRPIVDYKSGANAENGYYDNHAAGYTAYTENDKRSVGYSAYSDHDTEMPDMKRARYTEYRNYTSTEL